MLDWKDEKDAMCIITNSNTEILAKYLSSSPGSKYFPKGASHPMQQEASQSPGHCGKQLLHSPVGWLTELTTSPL